VGGALWDRGIAQWLYSIMGQLGSLVTGTH